MQNKSMLALLALLLLCSCGTNSSSLQRFPPYSESGRMEVPAPLPEQESALPPQHLRAQKKQEENSDVVGWLHIPDTSIDDAVLYKNDGNNSYYYYRDFYGNYSYFGSYYADFRSSFGGGFREDLARNTVIYGYSGEDPEDIRFSQIKRYAEPAFAASHPYLYFSALQEDMAWEIFAVFYAHIDLPYNRTDLDEAEFDAMLQTVLDMSIYDYGREITQQDKILTLSTGAYAIPDASGNLTPAKDYGAYRFAVMARLLPPGEAQNKRAEFSVRDIPQIAFAK